MQGKVEICGVNTSRLPTLDAQRTRKLLLRAKKGDKAAREELIAGNLRLVLSVIQRFAARGENIDDLFQVGCVGLIKAVDNFDCDSHDVRFSTYAAIISQKVSQKNGLGTFWKWLKKQFPKTGKYRFWGIAEIVVGELNLKQGVLFFLAKVREPSLKFFALF